MPSRSVRIIERLGLVAIAAAIFMVVSIGVYTLYQSTRWDPLAEYPIQNVTPFPTKGGVRIVDPHDSNPGSIVTEANDNSTSSGVQFYLDEDIHSSGIKCVNPEEDIVRIKGTLYWQSDQPPGRFLKVGEGANDRGPGCQQYDFSNPIPKEVRAEIERLTAEGFTQSEWHLTGTEIPIRDNGEEGVARTWITTSFTIIHENRPR